jgi:ABC-2 type transport system ATP-binding protein
VVRGARRVYQGPLGARSGHRGYRSGVAGDVISARGLTKRFGKVLALDGLDLDVPAGAALGLLGPAGAGKSTFVRLLAGLARPSAGTVTIVDAPAGSMAANARLGVLLQDAQLYGWMTGREALAFAADLAGAAAAEIAEAIDGVAGRLSIGGLLDERVAGLAAPARGRLAIAQALLGEPEVLVLDEPFQWLDPEGRSEVLGVLSELRGVTTIILAAHRPADIEALCGCLAVLEAGRLVRQASLPAGR